jgi:hypothetical protein
MSEHAVLWLDGEQVNIGSRYHVKWFDDRAEAIEHRRRLIANGWQAWLVYCPAAIVEVVGAV